MNKYRRRSYQNSQDIQKNESNESKVKKEEDSYPAGTQDLNNVIQTGGEISSSGRYHRTFRREKNKEIPEEKISKPIIKTENDIRKKYGSGKKVIENMITSEKREEDSNTKKEIIQKNEINEENIKPPSTKKVISKNISETRKKEINKERQDNNKKSQFNKLEAKEEENKNEDNSFLIKSRQSMPLLSRGSGLIEVLGNVEKSNVNQLLRGDLMELYDDISRRYSGFKERVFYKNIKNFENKVGIFDKEKIPHYNPNDNYRETLNNIQRTDEIIELYTEKASNILDE